MFFLLSLLLLPSSLYVLVCSHIQPEYQIEVEKQQTIHSCHRNQSKYESHKCTPLTYYTRLVGLISLCSNKHPNSRTNNGDAKESDSHKQTYKLCIIFPTYTVIEIFAMMIEFLDTSLASLTMMTLLMNFNPTIEALNHFLLLIFPINF